MKTYSVEFKDGKDKYKLNTEYGLQHFEGQTPCFSITAFLYRWKKIGKLGRWVEDSCGCLHDDIVTHVPKFKPLIKWHLCSFEQPMHYIANGMFWWERSLMEKNVPMFKGDICAIGEEALKNFKSTIVFGAIDEDLWAQEALQNRKGIDKDRVCNWLIGRRPMLMETFLEDMIRYGVE